MNPETGGNDEVFLFATEISHDTATDTWRLEVDPDSSLVGPATDRDVAALRTADCERVATDSGYAYRGRLLFSAGVVVLLNGQLVLLQRDAGAPYDPGRWQSPAGRCDGPPGETALRELYEELLVFEGDTPVFIEYGDRSADFEKIYQSRLASVGGPTNSEAWARYRGTVPAHIDDAFATVELVYGDTTYTGEMLAVFDEANSTLELRYLLASSVADPDSLRFLDPEYDRRIDRFTPSAVAGMADLAPADAALAQRLYPQLD